MKYNVYTVYDSKAEAYLQPFYFSAKGQAIRAFTDMANDQNHQFYKHPEDYTLFELGSWEDSTASFHVLATPNSMGLALEFKTQRELPDMSLKLADMKGRV